MQNFKLKPLAIVLFSILITSAARADNYFNPSFYLTTLRQWLIFQNLKKMVVSFLEHIVLIFI